MDEVYEVLNELYERFDNLIDTLSMPVSDRIHAEAAREELPSMQSDLEDVLEMIELLAKEKV